MTDTEATSATARPWKFVAMASGSHDSDMSHFSIYPADKKPGYSWRIADLNWFPVGNGPSKEETKANAALIVTAVNERETLLAALKDCVNALDHALKCHGVGYTLSGEAVEAMRRASKRAAVLSPQPEGKDK